MARQISNQDNFAYLTVALVLLLLSTALVDQLEIELGQFVVQAAIVIVLGLGVWSIRGDNRWIRTRVGFVITITLVTLAGLFFELAGLDILWLLVVLVFLVTMAWFAIQQVLFTGSVDWNKIIGTICIYLLMGLIWATIYMITAELIPGVFNGLASAPWYETFPDLVYFSFVTLTTLGYGDMGHATPLTRFLSSMEAIVGQFYLAILVASLVGIRISHELK